MQHRLVAMPHPKRPLRPCRELHAIVGGRSEPAPVPRRDLEPPREDGLREVAVDLGALGRLSVEPFKVKLTKRFSWPPAR